MKNHEETAQWLEEQMQRAEKVLQRLGAVPQDINQRNREVLGQRVTYLLGSTYCRVDSAEFDGKLYILLSAIEEAKFAGIGLMEDIEAVPADAPDKTIERKFRAALEQPTA